jgi:hypothetical protein
MLHDWGRSGNENHFEGRQTMGWFKKAEPSELASHVTGFASDEWLADTWHCIHLPSGFYIRHQTGHSADQLELFSVKSGKLPITSADKRLLADYADALRVKLAFSDRKLDFSQIPSLFTEAYDKNFISDFYKELEFSYQIAEIMKSFRL